MSNTSVFLLHVRDQPLIPQEAGTRVVEPDEDGVFGPIVDVEERWALQGYSQG